MLYVESNIQYERLYFHQREIIRAHNGLLRARYSNGQKYAKGVAEDVVAKQLTKSATSIGANYREASHAKSPNDFAAKLKICESEAAETLYWIQLIINSELMSPGKMQALENEARELVAIFTAATKRAYTRRK
ncbi:MAG: four helix bundle protein [Akkermansia sp.]|nr:four helix bundle protein [Akkermansia sp.]